MNYKYLIIAMACSTIIFVVMMILQRRRERNAHRKFHETLKYRGLNQVLLEDECPVVMNFKELQRKSRGKKNQK